MIPPHLIDEVRSRTDFATLVGRHTKLRKSGRELHGKCPFCDNKDAFYLNLQRGWYCHACGAGGDLFEFDRQTRGGSFLDALKRLASECQVDLPGPGAPIPPEDPDLDAKRALRATERVEEERIEAEEEASDQAAAAEDARARWEAAAAHPVDPHHPYLKRKGLQGSPLIQDRNLLRQEGDLLLLPMRSLEKGSPVVNVQTIPQAHRGRKLFYPGARVLGTRLTMGVPKGWDGTGRVYLVEGFATGVSVQEATGAPVVVCFTVGNLAPVATAISAAFPDAELVIAADNDRWSEFRRGGEALRNPGLWTARQIPGVKVAWPEFLDFCPNLDCKRKDAGGPHPTDFNDLHQIEGIEAVQRWIVPRPESSPPPPEDAPPPAPADLQGPVVLDKDDPYPGARVFIARHHQTDGFQTLYEHAGVFYAYNGAAYPETATAGVRSELWTFADQALTMAGNPFKPTTTKIGNLLDATRGITHLPTSHAPFWIGPNMNGATPPANEVISFPNGILEVRTRKLHPPTPRLFTHQALPFDFQPTAPPPARWLQFLHQVWGDDEGKVDDDVINTLQEMFGYFLLPDTSQQKVFMLVGPPRSGKGTIGRVLKALLGEVNVCAPTLDSLSGFGLQPLIGCLLAIVSDARLGARSDQAQIAERLLSISGEDNITISRKYLGAWTGALPTRFLILTNELPALQDTSGALASRFIVLTMERSFLGKENPGLTRALLLELPGILLWALDGLNRLTARGFFLAPESSQDAMRELGDLGSPVAAFVRDCCNVGPGYRAFPDDIYAAWKRWCVAQGRDHPGTVATLGRNLRAAVPGLKQAQARFDGDRRRYYEGINLKDAMP